jgi:hypothetical protein
VDWRTEARQRFELLEEQIKRDKEESARKRKEGRPRGELTKSLKDHLRNCNTQQLRNAIALCREFLKDHRVAPSLYDCHRGFQGITVLVSVAVGNKRYQLERQPCGKNCAKCPNHGPYLYVYCRNGALFPGKSLGAYPFKAGVPRKVRTAIRSWKREEDVLAARR